ncbi:hypothetical protein JXB12_06535, partial [candidate division KSB1 bacterium]|nr:hypothetical protein [candidate division KSB1 bacterium]
MKKTPLLFVLFLLYAIPLQATVHHVPGNYGSIQEAINASAHTDSVLVDPNIYFENINFKGKNIVVASLFLTTRDTTLISQTIIDGSANGPVVTIKNHEDSTAMLIGFTIRNGKTNYGGGIYIESSSPFISNCIVRNNAIEGSNPIGGGIYLRGSRSTVYACEIMFNTATAMDNNNGWGGGISSIQSTGRVTIINCKIHHNQVTSCYGGIGLADTEARIIGCEISNNISYSGGSGIGCQDSDLELINCTVTQNGATGRNNPLYFIQSAPVIRNCIIWHNKKSDRYASVGGFESTPEIVYSNIEGGFDTLVVMNLEPMFVDTTAGDFRLRSDSPCIDAGDPDTVGLNLPPYDLCGNIRIKDGDSNGIPVIDMGAYEYASPAVRIENPPAPNNPKAFDLRQNYPNP